MTCMFLGHRDCFDLEPKVLQTSIEELIKKGVNNFYVGHQGYFDSMVFSVLKTLKEKYMQITFFVVLAYMPTVKEENNYYGEYSIYPDGIENAPKRFAIERRNSWMIARSDICLCYVAHTWGGAYKFAKKAKNKGLTIFNLAQLEI